MIYQSPQTREEHDREIAQIRVELERSPILKAKLTYMSQIYAEQGATTDFKTCLEDLAVATGVC